MRCLGATVAWWWPCPEHRVDVQPAPSRREQPHLFIQTHPCESIRCLMSGLKGQHCAWWNNAVSICFQKLTVFIQLWKKSQCPQRASWSFFIYLSNNSTQTEEAGGVQGVCGGQVSIWTLNFKRLVWGECKNSEKLHWYCNFLSEGPDPSHSIPSSKQSRISALPWALQRTTSRHSGCALAGSPPLGPCTLSSRRTSTPACHGRWPPYSDQNLQELKQKRTCQVSENYYYLCFWLLKLFAKDTPTTWWSTLLSVCSTRVLEPCLHGVPGTC